MTNAAVRSGGRQVRRILLAIVLTALLTTAGLMAGARTVLADEAPWQAEVEFDIPAQNTTLKKEVVYANLSATGHIIGVYVVNILEPDKPGVVVDFGSYDNVQNLTDAGGAVEEGDAIAVNVEGESLSYQGDLGSAALPWNISVSYELDGLPISPDDLGGKSGDLQMVVKTTRNEAVNATYFDNYLLQISVVLGQDVANDVVAPDGQIAMAGSDTQVTFMAMPGKNGLFTVRAQVQNFEMTGITFAAVPLSFAVDADTGDLVSDFSKLSDGVGELADGAGSLADGAGELASGFSGLEEGMFDLSEGVNALAEGLPQVASGMTTLSTGLQQYQQGLQAGAASAQGQIVSQETLQAEYESAMQAYLQAYLSAYTPVYMQKYAELSANPDTQASAAQQAAYEAAVAAASDSNVLAAQQQLQAAVGAIGASAGAQGAYEALSGAAAGLGSLDAQESLIGGMAGIASGVAALVPGSAELADGAEELAGGASEVAEGAEELAEGTEQLAEGTAELYTEVQKMPDAVQEEIDAMLASYDKSNYKPVSFTSSKNTNVELVQFVIATDPIVAPEMEAEVVVEEEKTFIDRFFDLFR